MSEATHEGMWRRLRWPYAALTVYFALLILPRTLPSWAASDVYLVYLVSVPLVLVALMVLGLWGGVGILRSASRELPRKRSHWTCVRAASVGLLAFSAALLVVRLLPEPLPPGSDLLPFDRTVWQAQGADASVGRAHTPRQQMLAAVVEMLPGRGREQILSELGPSDTSGDAPVEGQDLSYRLGHQRRLALGLDSEWLLIWIVDGRYQRHELVAR